LSVDRGLEWPQGTDDQGTLRARTDCSINCDAVPSSLVNESPGIDLLQQAPEALATLDQKAPGEIGEGKYLQDRL
jgi:hypothetical protein